MFEEIQVKEDKSTKVTGNRKPRKIFKNRKLTLFEKATEISFYSNKEILKT